MSALLVFFFNITTIVVIVKYYGSIIKRALSSEMEDIGVWNRIFKIISTMAVLFNALVLLFPAHTVIEELLGTFIKGYKESAGEENGGKSAQSSSILEKTSVQEVFCVAVLTVIIFAIRLFIDKRRTTTPSWVLKRSDLSIRKQKISKSERDYFWNKDFSFAEMFF